MPMYEYYCQPCDKTYERLKLIREAPKSIQCKSCGGLAEKVMSAFHTPNITRAIVRDGIHRNI